MNIGIIGLGKMGEAIAYRLITGGHHVVAYDPNAQARDVVAGYGATVVDHISALAHTVSVVWVMVPAGTVTNTVVTDLIKQLPPQTIIIDGGNSYYKDSIQLAALAKKSEIAFLDCGTSGGIHGKEHGFCLMVGGDKESYDTVLPLLKTIAAPEGVAHVGPSGTGHYVKMVHNGIEYGLLQAYAEGFHLLKEGQFAREKLDLHLIAHLWQQSSIIRSFILSLTENIMAKDQNLTTVSGEIGQHGTGRWTVEAAHATSIPLFVIEEALRVRSWSQETGGNYATKLVALMRHEFGGHPVNRIPEHNE